MVAWSLASDSANQLKTLGDFIPSEILRLAQSQATPVPICETIPLKRGQFVQTLTKYVPRVSLFAGVTYDGCGVTL